ncbi:MAG: hypothetical protein E7666_01165 [Ruminococcaceae bacterium]|nr:hypothetical protein [Oscillospiraceae bacterium]
MKKRIFALLLAGLLTTSLVSCISTKPRPDDPGLDESGSEDTISRSDTTDEIITVTWKDVNKTVYVTASTLTLTKVEDNTKTIKKTQMSELLCLKISSDAKRCIVEVDGVQYYASASALTDADLLGKNFTACTPKTMYADGSVNIRKYASSDGTYSPVIKTLASNDAVTVVATGGNWSKIKYDENNFYFIFSENLSETPVVDHDKVDYSSYFTACTPTLKMYVTASSSLTVRKNASVDSSALTWLAKDTEVTVIAQGTIDGTKWYKILVPDEIEEGQTQTYSEGYVTDKYLSESKGNVSMTLADMLVQYPAFVEKNPALTLYVSSDALNVRSTPAFPTEDDNIVATLQKKAQVKVVAVGNVEGTNWAMIETTDGKYCFVGYSKLTTDPEGKPIEVPLTFEELIAKYSFTDCADKTVSAKGTVNCYTAPENQATAVKTLKSGDRVTVLASGTVSYTEWYLFTVEGDSTYYFAGASLFENLAE